MACKYKKGMEVIVISGREKGKTGKILRLDHEKNRVIVVGVNMIKRATRPNQKNQQGGFVEKEAAFNMSNILAIDPVSKKPTRVGFAMIGGKKTRVSRASGQVVEA